MDYQNGKIYKITNCIDDEVYIGSTCAPLTKRWYKHKWAMNNERDNNTKVYQHMTKIGIDKFSISLVENYPCTNKSELFRREGELTRQLGTLNMCIPGRTLQEWNEDNKEKIAEQKKKYNEENKEVINEYQKEYRNENKEQLSDKKKKWSENNKESIDKYKQKYYQKNKDNLILKSRDHYENNKEKILKKVECEVCKSIVSHTNLLRHQKSKKCLAVSVGNMNVCKGSQA